MAEPLEKRRKQQKNKTGRKRPRRKSSAPTESEVIAGDQDAGDMLRAAIVERVIARCGDIADAVVDNTVDGNAGVSRLLVDYLDEKKARKSSADKPGGLSWSRNWAAEQQWQGTVDPDDDIGFGGREPEV